MKFDRRFDPVAQAKRFRPAKSVAFLLLLGACATTTITDATNPVLVNPDDWAVNDLPVELHGTTPGHSQAQLAALFPNHINFPGPNVRYASNSETVAAPPRRIAIYVNGAALPPDAELCEAPGMFREGPQTGQSAKATAALCSGPTVISTAKGIFLAQRQSDKTLAQGLSMMQTELRYALYPPPSFSN